MKYLTMTFEYLFKRAKGKHFFVFGLFALLPSVVLAYFFPASNLIGVFANYNTIRIENFGWLWLNIYSHSQFSGLAFFSTFVLYSFSAASICTIITRHFRVNDFSVPKLFKSVNENFFPALTVVVSIYILITALHTVGCLFMYWFFAIPNKVIALVLSVIIEMGLIFGAVYVVSALTLWMPIMSFNGLKMFTAMSTAFYKSRSFHKSAFINTLIPVLISLSLSVVAYFLKDVWYLKWIVNTASYIFGTVVLITLNFVTFCEVEGVSREDLLQSPYKRR